MIIGRLLVYGRLESFLTLGECSEERAGLLVLRALLLQHDSGHGHATVGRGLFQIIVI